MKLRPLTWLALHLYTAPLKVFGESGGQPAKSFGEAKNNPHSPGTIMNFHILFFLGVLVAFSGKAVASDNVIEQQLEEIGSIPNEEVVVVQRKYTRKNWRHEFSPISVGGVPFGTVRRTLSAGGSYTLHANDWLGLELFNFTYTKNFFSSFTDDINLGQLNGGNDCNAGGGRPCVRPDFQKLLYFLTTGVQLTPFYGKVSTFSRWIAYVEPYFTLGLGLAKTETDQYLTYYPGVGIRAYFKEWFSMKLEFRDYMYTEKTVNRDQGGNPTTAFRNNYSVMVAFSFWLPKMPR